MKVKTPLYRFFICFLIVSFLQGTWGSGAMALTVGEERDIGEKLLYQIRLSFPLVDDPDIYQYINNLGDEVLEVAGGHFFSYHFNIINSSQFNAFAAPSGLVFFYSGLIEKMDHEDELVSVLAHEIGHVVSRHIAKGMDQGRKIGLASTLLALGSLALGAGAVSQALLTGSLAAGQAVTLHFSRENEEEADRLAYTWMKAMGRNPKGQEEMLQVMRRITRYTMGNSVPQYLLTHPYPAERLEYVESLISYEKDRQQKFEVTDEFAFLRMKYRILSMVKDGKDLRSLLRSSLADAKEGGLQQMMLTYGLSQLDRMENNFESSKKRLAEVIEYFPKQTILLVDLALVERASGNREGALVLLRKAYEGNRQDMWAGFQLGRLLLTLGRYHEAERYLQEVVLMIPDYSKAYFELGMLKAKQGEAGNSSYFLGKYNLYEGRLKLARYNFKNAAAGSGLDEAHKADIQEMQDLIARLEGKEKKAH